VGFFYISDDTGVQEVEHDGGVVVLAAGGEIDYAASPRLRERIARHIDAGGRHLVLDLTHVAFIDSTAIGVLIGTVMKLRELGDGSLTVVCSEENRRVMRIFEIAGVDSLFSLHRSREDALSALAAAG